MKNNTYISTLHDFSHKIYFYCWKKLKNMNFYSKMVWPPPPYDVISRNHRNLPLLNLTQNAREGWTNSYWKKIRCWCFIVYEKIQKNFSGGWHPLHVQGLKQTPLNRSQTVTGTVQTTYWRTHEAKKKKQLQENDWTTDHLTNNKRLFSCDNRLIETPMTLRVFIANNYRGHQLTWYNSLWLWRWLPYSFANSPRL